MNRLPIPGTLLNTATVLAGSTIGLLLGQAIPEGWLKTALLGLGLFNMALGVKMFLRVHNVLLVAGSMAIGGILGAAVDSGVELPGLKNADGLLAASLLFCVGPMTLLGCVQDAVEGKSELLQLKSLLDGIASILLAATMGVSVLFSAFVVLVVQGALTVLGGRLRGVAQDGVLLDEFTALGGLLILGIGLRLTEIQQIPVANFLPGFLILPLLMGAIKKFSRRALPPA